MKTFSFTATNSHGRRIDGVINGKNQAEAFSKIKNSGFSPITIKEIDIKSLNEKPTFWKRLKIFFMLEK